MKAFGEAVMLLGLIVAMAMFIDYTYWGWPLAIVLVGGVMASWRA